MTHPASGGCLAPGPTIRPASAIERSRPPSALAAEPSPPAAWSVGPNREACPPPLRADLGSRQPEPECGRSGKPPRHRPSTSQSRVAAPSTSCVGHDGHPRSGRSLVAEAYSRCHQVINPDGQVIFADAKRAVRQPTGPRTGALGPPLIPGVPRHFEVVTNLFHCHQPFEPCHFFFRSLTAAVLPP